MFSSKQVILLSQLAKKVFQHLGVLVILSSVMVESVQANEVKKAGKSPSLLQSYAAVLLPGGQMVTIFKGATCIFKVNRQTHACFCVGMGRSKIYSTFIYMG